VELEQDRREARKRHAEAAAIVEAALDLDRPVPVLGGEVELAAHGRDRCEIRERDRHPRRVPMPLEDRDALAVQRLGAGEVAALHRNPAELRRAATDLVRLVELTVDLQRARPSRRGGGEVARARGERRRAPESLRAQVRLARPGCDRVIERAPPLRDPPADEPEPTLRLEEPHLRLDVARLDRPGERAAEVVLLVVEETEALGLGVAALEDRRPRALRELEEPRDVAAAVLLLLPARPQALERVLAHGLEQVEPLAAAPDEARFHERLEPEGGAAAEDAGERAEREAAGEDRRASEQQPLILAEEGVAPVERRAQGPLPRRQVAGAADEQVESPLEPLLDRRQGQRAHARGRQLDRERQAVEPSADPGDRRRGRGRQGKRRVDRARTRREQRDRLRRRDLGERAAGIGHGQRRDRVLVLAAQAHRHPARRDDAQARRIPEQSRNRLGRVLELLEVVEDEEQRGALQPRGELRRIVDLERLRDAGADERRVGDRRQVDEGGAVSKTGRERLGHREREPRLPRAAWAGQRHQPDVVAAEDRLDRGQLEPAADERTDRRRQAGPHAARRAPGRKCGILPEDRALELLQAGSGFDTELVDEHAPRGPVGLERVLLPAGAVEREDVLLAQALAVGLRRDPLLERGHELGVPAQREPGVDEELVRLEPELLELRGGRGHGVPLEVGERLALPESERPDELLLGGGRGAAGERAPRVLEQALET